VLSTDGHQISVRIPVDQDAPRRGQHASPSLALHRPCLRDLPNHFSRLDVERAKVLLPRFELWARLVPRARRTASYALFEHHQVIETCRRAECRRIPIRRILGAAYAV